MARSNRPGACYNSRVLLILFLLLAVLAGPVLAIAPVSADWGQAVQITASPSSANFPEIGACGNTVHVVWQDWRDSPPSAQRPAAEIYYKRSTNAGQTWGADVRLTNDPAHSDYPDIAVLGNAVHVVWLDERTGNTEIFYKRSVDGGQTWGPDMQLTNTLVRSNYPRVAASANGVYVVFYRSQSIGAALYFKRSMDGGQTWGPDTQLVSSDYNIFPDIAAAGNGVYIVWIWSNISSNHIYFMKSIDTGQTWGPCAQVSATGANSLAPTVGVSGNYVNVVWTDFRDGIAHIYRNRSMDGGQTWPGDSRLSTGDGGAVDVAISVLGASVDVVWIDFRISEEKPEVFYKHSADNGATWGTDTRLTTNASPADAFPSIAASATNVYVVFADSRVTNHDQIYFIKYTGPLSVGSVDTPLGTVRLTASDGSFSGLRAVDAGCAPAGYNFPYGMIAFNLINLAPGETVTVTITFPNPIPSNAKYFKCQDSGAVDCSSFMTIVDQNTIRLRLTDGGNGDSDHSANGTIVDPGGPGFPLNLNPTSHGASMPALAQSPVALSNVSVKSASLSANKVAPGTPVTVTAQVANNGAVNGTGRITVYVNGTEESVQGVTVNSGSTMPVTFTVSRSQPGVYSVYVGGMQAGSFTVDEFADPNTVLYISMGLLGLALVVGAVYFTRRRQQAG